MSGHQDWYGLVRATLVALDTEIAATKDVIADGGLSLEDYRNRCGVIEGLRRARRAFGERLNDEERRSLGVELVGAAGKGRG